MPTFRLRAWMEQTLYDCHDYVVEADTIEDAARRLHEAHEQASLDGSADCPAGISRIRFVRANGDDDLLADIRLPDPAEVIGSEAGIVEIDKHGRKLRDVLPCGTVAERVEPAA